ncbi:MAG: tRNA lysidine(34) synthetase TilS [Paludibacteraceae bacterium]|nr:tRNA lysidine(34) synthetase TilS [Paludibacteraceae bacterium]
MTDKVAAYIAQHQLLDFSSPIIVGVSGGADSICLLNILKALGYDCIAAHCNFELRGDESDRDEHFVQAFCQQTSIPLHCRHFDTKQYAARHKLSIEMAARELRYRWFEELRQKTNAQAIAVAHHQDDSIETCLLNLLRGTGIQGMTGIHPKNGHLVRPLLALSRTDIEQYLTDNGLQYITDSTNLQNDYTRNKIRNRLIPLMEEINPQFRQTMVANMESFAATSHLYRDTVDRAKSKALQNNGLINLPEVKAFIEPKTLLFDILQPYGFHPAEINKILQGTTGNRYIGRNAVLTLIRQGKEIWGKLGPLRTNETECLG